jgi:hypothetical protein
MADQVKCILELAFQLLPALLYCVWVYKTNYKKPTFDKPLFIYFLIVIWLILIFNAVYTIILGCHPMGSPNIGNLERRLDNISMAGILTSFIILFNATHKRVR